MMPSTLLRSAVLFAALALPLVVASRASAGGYDTPILYSARHMGMGGTAVSYVNDPSALFHNPAGLGKVGRGSLIANVSPLIGSISAPQGDSETTFAPFFLVGGAGRITKWLSAGFAIYPVASAGAEYKNGDATDSTTLLFVEASPGVAFTLPGNVDLGLSYRITYVSLDRFQGTEDNPGLDFEMDGYNFAGFRAGAQWHEEFGDHQLKFGAHYRHKTETTVENDEGSALRQTLTDISTKFTLPTRFSFGPRYDYKDFGVALDVEYALNSQNKTAPLKGTLPTGMEIEVGNVFRWSNAFTVRTGFEYRLLEGKVPVRLGYIWDQKTSNPQYASAFGTPPGPSYVATLGGGYNAGAWQVNGAYAYRTSQGEVTAEDVAGREDTCSFCSGAGDYDLTMHGVYIDFSYDWK